MTTFLALLLMGASWEPAPPVVAKVLTVAPDACVFADGYVAGLMRSVRGFS